ncbi:hypothetical protein ACJX0J_033198, partial [Zea mays]
SPFIMFRSQILESSMRYKTLMVLFYFEVVLMPVYLRRYRIFLFSILHCQFLFYSTNLFILLRFLDIFYLCDFPDYMHVSRGQRIKLLLLLVNYMRNYLILLKGQPHNVKKLFNWYSNILSLKNSRIDILMIIATTILARGLFGWGATGADADLNNCTTQLGVVAAGEDEELKQIYLFSVFGRYM